MTEEEMQARIAELEGELNEAKESKKTAIGEKNNAKRELKTLEDRISDLERERDDATDAGKSDLERERDKVAKLEGTVKNLTAEIGGFKIDAVINEAITANRVQVEDVDLVRTYLKDGVTVDAKGNAMKGDKPLNDSITDFFASDLAKRYVAAPANTGAGATGSASKVQAPNKMPETQEEWDKFYRSVEGKPEETAAALKSWGL